MKLLIDSRSLFSSDVHLAGVAMCLKLIRSFSQCKVWWTNRRRIDEIFQTMHENPTEYLEFSRSYAITVFLLPNIYYERETVTRETE